MTNSPPVGSQYTPLQLLDAFIWKIENHSIYQDYESAKTDNAANALVGTSGMPQKEEEYTFLNNQVHRWSSEIAKQHNTLHAPINRLPLEVISRIFLLLQEEDETGNLTHGGDFTANRRDRANQPMSWLIPFTAVCHHWRQVAMSTPTFWQNITVPHDHNGRIRLARLFLTRSAPALIRVSLLSKRSDFVVREGQGTHAWLAFIAALKENIHRIEVLDIPAPLSSYPELLELSQLPLPNANSLSLNFVGGFSGIDQDEPTVHYDKFAHSIVAPALRSLRLDHVSPRVPPGLLHHLTHLHLHRPHFGNGASELHVHECLDLLQLAPKLRKLALEYLELSVGADTKKVEQLQPVHLCHLQQLRILDERDEPAVLLIRKLVTPKSTDIEWPVFARSISTAPQDPQVDAARTSFLPFDDIQYLVCDEPPPDFMRSNSQRCRMQSGLLQITHDCLFNRLIDKLVNIRILAIGKIPSNSFKWPTFFRSAATEECHVYSDDFNPIVFQTLERRERPLFPNLITLTIWKRPRNTFGGSSTSGLGRLFSEAVPQTSRGVGQETRRKLNGATYNVRWRDLDAQQNIFTFSGMAAYIRVTSSA